MNQVSFSPVVVVSKPNFYFNHISAQLVQNVETENHCYEDVAYQVIESVDGFSITCTPKSSRGLLNILGRIETTETPDVKILDGKYLVKVAIETSETLTKMFGYKFEPIVYFNEQALEPFNADCPNTNTKRSRETRTILYTKNFMTTFRGGDIAGICSTVLVGCNKAGKWSSQDYQVFCAAGVKVIHVQQDWDTGKYINAYTSPTAMLKSLSDKIEGLTIPAFMSFLELELPSTFKTHKALIADIAAFEEKGILETISYTFTASIEVNRQGWKHLLIDGVVWNPEKQSDNCPVIEKSRVISSGHRGGSKVYELEIKADCLIEELYQDGYEGDDTLKTRGYVMDDNREWSKPASNANTPFAGLFGKK